ncbi:hypothetical protein WJX77_008784 [Trebouxia sp. C0004]
MAGPLPQPPPTAVPLPFHASVDHKHLAEGIPIYSWLALVSFKGCSVYWEGCSVFQISWHCSWPFCPGPACSHDERDPGSSPSRPSSSLTQEHGRAAACAEAQRLCGIGKKILQKAAEVIQRTGGQALAMYVDNQHSCTFYASKELAAVATDTTATHQELVQKPHQRLRLYEALLSRFTAARLKEQQLQFMSDTKTRQKTWRERAGNLQALAKLTAQNHPDNSFLLFLEASSCRRIVPAFVMPAGTAVWVIWALPGYSIASNKLVAQSPMLVSTTASGLVCNCEVFRDAVKQYLSSSASTNGVDNDELDFNRVLMSMRACALISLHSQTQRMRELRHVIQHLGCGLPARRMNHSPIQLHHLSLKPAGSIRAAALPLT